MGLFRAVVLLSCLAGVALAGDMMRRSIVFNPGTPDVFYCPPYKPKSLDDMLVKARPLSKLCEYKGRPLPQDHVSDCFNDVDETEYACSEKHRIMMRLRPPVEEDRSDLENFIDEFDYKFHGGL